MNIPTKHEYFLNMINTIKSRSKDKSQQVGCVIVSENDSILSTGYNGFPRGVNDEIKEIHERPLKYKWTEHSERNAIYNAARNGVRLENSIIYLQVWPCCDCARAIAQSGISKIIIDGRGYFDRLKSWSRWEEDFTISHEILNACSIDRTVWFPHNCICIHGTNWKLKSFSDMIYNYRELHDGGIQND